MTNAEIIFREAQELAKQGIIQYTGRVAKMQTPDRQIVEIKETEAVERLNRQKGKHMFKMIYWLPNQSKLFSEPQYYETDDRDNFIHALQIANENGYEIEFATEL